MRIKNIIVCSSLFALSLLAFVPYKAHALPQYDISNDIYMARAVKKSPPSAKRGIRVYKKKCLACHALANRFIGLTKASLTTAKKTIPDMKSVKLSAQETKDLLKYLSTVQ